MNWAEIRQVYASTCGQSPAAMADSLLHLSEANRTVSARLNVQDSETVQNEQATVASQDYVNLPSGLLHVIHVYEKVSGNEIIPEEGGIRGRAQHLAATTGMPPEGAPQYYAISNGRLYLRPTPDSTSYTVVIRGKAQPSDITEADLGDEPSLPAHYHMAVAWEAARSFLLTHPTVAKEQSGEGMNILQSLESQIEMRLRQTDILPKDRERFDNRSRVRLRGFRFRR